MVHGARRDFEGIVLPDWGGVRAWPGPAPWLVVDDVGDPVESVQRFMVDFVARDNRPGSVRSYAYALLRWWRWLLVRDVSWDRVTPEDARDLVLWMQQAEKPLRRARTVSVATAGSVNAVTGKRYLDSRYQPRTIRHGLAVVRAFYEYWGEMGQGPVRNPVQLTTTHTRSNAHHNPIEPFRSEGRIRYSPRIPRRLPRHLSDAQWTDVFDALTTNRDRALLSLAVSNGARAAETLGIRGVDVDWGNQLVRVFRKGTRAEQWLPASAESFVWLRLHLAETSEDIADPTTPVWRTVRRRDYGDGLVRQSLNYDALRAVFRRVNARLGTNWTMHDLRHTAALRMSQDSNLSITDVQRILGHQHVSTTAEVYLVQHDVDIAKRVLEHLAERERRTGSTSPPALPVTSGYDPADLDTLFGSRNR